MGATPAPEAQVRRGAVGDPGARPGEPLHVREPEVDGVGAPDVRRQPLDVRQVVDRPVAVLLHAEGLVLDRLGQVGVEPQPQPSREPGGLEHELPRRRERRAGRHHDLHPRAGARLVEPGHPLGVGEDPVDVLHDRVRRQRAPRLPQVHRAPGGHDADAQLPRGLDLGLHEAGAAVGEHVVMVEDGRAARERELGQPGAGGGVLGLGVETRPDREQGLEPLEEVAFLGPGPGEVLVDVVVHVDEARGDDGAPEVHGLVGRRRPPAAHRLDPALADQEPAARVLGAGVVHGDDVGVGEERRAAGRRGHSGPPPPFDGLRPLATPPH